MDKEQPKQRKEWQRYLFLPVTVSGDANKKLAVRIPVREDRKTSQNAEPPTLKFKTLKSPEDYPRKPNGRLPPLDQSPAVARTGNSVKTWTMWRVVAKDHKEKMCRLAYVTNPDQKKVLQPDMNNSLANSPKQPTLLDRRLMGSRWTLIANSQGKNSPPDQKSSLSSPERPPRSDLNFSLNDIRKLSSAEFGVSTANSADAAQVDGKILAVGTEVTIPQPNITTSSKTSHDIRLPEPKSPIPSYSKNIPSPVTTSEERRLELLPSRSYGKVSRLSTLAADALLPPHRQENSVSQSSSPVTRDESKEVGRGGSFDTLRQKYCVSPESGIDCDEESSPCLFVDDGPESVDNPLVSGKKGGGLKETYPRRYCHSFLERKRRKEMRASFRALRNVLPELKNQEKVAKVTILKKGRERCLALRVRELALLSQKLGLIGRKRYLQQILNYLRNDDCSSTCSSFGYDEKLPFSLRDYDDFVRLLVKSGGLDAPTSSSGLTSTEESSSDVFSSSGAVYPSSTRSQSTEADVASTAGSSDSLSLPEQDADVDEDVDVVGLDGIDAFHDAKWEEHERDEDRIDIANELRIVSVHSLADKRLVFDKVSGRDDPLPNCSRLHIRKLKDRKCGLKRVLMLDTDYSRAETSIYPASNEHPVKKFQRMAEETDILINQIDSCFGLSSRFSPVTTDSQTRFCQNTKGGNARKSRKVLPVSQLGSGKKTLQLRRQREGIRDSAAGRERCDAGLRFSNDLNCSSERCTPDETNTEKHDRGDTSFYSEPATDVGERDFTQNHPKTDLEVDDVGETPEPSVPPSHNPRGGVKNCIPELGEKEKPPPAENANTSIVIPRSDASATVYTGSKAEHNSRNSDFKVESSRDSTSAKVGIEPDSNQAGAEPGAHSLVENRSLAVDKAFGDSVQNCSEHFGTCVEFHCEVGADRPRPTQNCDPNYEVRRGHHSEDDGCQLCTSEFADQFCEDDRLTGESLLEGDDRLLLSTFDEEDPSPFVNEELSEDETSFNTEFRCSSKDRPSVGKMSPVVSISRISVPGSVALASSVEERAAQPGRNKGDSGSSSIRVPSKPNRISELRKKLKQKEADLEKVRESMCSFDDISL